MAATLRPAGQERAFAFLGYFLMPLFPIFLFVPKWSHPLPLWGNVLALLVFSFAMAMMTCEVFVVRLVADNDRITIFNRLNRKRLDVRYDQIESYRPDAKGKWRIWVNGVGYAPPPIEIGQLHRIMRLRAPKTLGAKRWRCGQVPPNDDSRGIRAFDFEQTMRSCLLGSC